MIPWLTESISLSLVITTFTLSGKRCRVYESYDIIVKLTYQQLASLKLPRTLDSLSQISPFTPTGGPLSGVHKTGLGSSAALITSLVSGLLLHFSTIPSTSLSGESSDGRLLANNLAQYVHCLAQGKVGSGFDVSAAVFGSHLYTRFNPTVLHGLMNSDVVSASEAHNRLYLIYAFVQSASISTSHANTYTLQ